MTNKLEIHIIELPKINEVEDKKDKLLDWLYFINDANSERGKEAMSRNEYIKEAGNKLNRMSKDEEVKRIAELREKAVKDEMATYDKGLEVGLAQGKKEGIQEGLAQGKEEGLVQGKKEEKIQLIKNMYENGITIENIIKISKMKREEIEKIIK